jgi:hypothetical protein
MHVDQNNLRKKHDELQHAFREKNRKYLQTQELYDKLKRRAMLGQVQNAATDAVDNTIQASVLSSRLADHVGAIDQRLQPPHFTGNSMQYPQRIVTVASPQNMPPAFARTGVIDGWNGPSTQENTHGRCS